jgi:hypothetical protein
VGYNGKIEPERESAVKPITQAFALRFIQTTESKRGKNPGNIRREHQKERKRRSKKEGKKASTEQNLVSTEPMPYKIVSARKACALGNVPPPTESS